MLRGRLTGWTREKRQLRDKSWTFCACATLTARKTNESRMLSWSSNETHLCAQLLFTEMTYLFSANKQSKDQSSLFAQDAHLPVTECQRDQYTISASGLKRKPETEKRACVNETVATWCPGRDSCCKWPERVQNQIRRHRQRCSIRTCAEMKHQRQAVS